MTTCVGFELCPCRRHGRVIAASGFAGPEFGFVQHGLYTVITGMQFGRFEKDAAAGLMTAIMHSGLPSDFEDTDLAFLWRIELANLARDVLLSAFGDSQPELRYPSPKAIHRYLDQPPSSPMPSDWAQEVRRRFTGGT